MNGIGQQMQVMMPDLQDALMQHSAKQRQFDAANQLAQGGNGWGGIGEILGAALGAYKSNKYGGELDKSNSDINQQIAAFQEQKAQELAQMEAAKAQAEYERKKADEIAKFEREQAGKMDIARYKTDNAKSNAPVVNVNSGTEYGKIADGMMMKRSPDGSVQMVPIPGSPADKEARENKTKDVMSGITGFNDAGNIDKVITDSIQKASALTTGFMGNALSNIPGSDAYDLRENMKTIEADAAFSSLQDMRKNSKTGGALGAVSERELGLLSAAKAALSTSQSTEQFKENLTRYQQVRQNALKNSAKAYEMDYGQPAPWMNQEKEQPKQSQYSDGQVIRNPSTGETMVMKNGQWVPQ